MSDTQLERPRLRSSIDVTPIEQDDRQMLVLYDAAGLTTGNIALTGGAFAIVTLMNGENTLDEIQAAFAREFRQELPPLQLVEILNQLDEGGMLEGPVFEARYRRLEAAYRRAPARPSRAIRGDVNLNELRAELIAMINESQAAADGQQVVGLIAPHLDYERGRPCYADAYAQLRAQDDIERFVILGANHFGRSNTAVWTVKDYVTPLGKAETDRAFIDKLRERCGLDLGEHEIDHLHEHSVELQVVMLQALFESRPVRVVPILCPDACGPTGIRPADGKGPGLDEFADALAEVIGESTGRTCLIAAADLSHVGRRFGDERDLDDEFLKGVETDDRALLDLIKDGDAAGMVERLQKTENARRVCSTGGLYVLLRVLRGAKARLLRYHQAVDPEQHTGVTCAAAVLTSDGAG